MEPPGLHTAWGMGDATWPLRVDAVVELQQRPRGIHQCSSEWKAADGLRVSPDKDFPSVVAKPRFCLQHLPKCRDEIGGGTLERSTMIVADLRA
eukprot:6523912-Lingulodinium_polyedra.AAC.1